MAKIKNSYFQYNEIASIYPTNYPMYNSGKLTYKVKLKKDFIRSDGTCAIYVQLFCDGKKKMLPVNYSCAPENWDEKKQRVKSNIINANDINLVIEKKLADINKIEVFHRLSGKILTMDILIDELNNSFSRANFLSFWQNELEIQKNTMSLGTYKQQLSVLQKVKSFKNPILFQEINEKLLIELETYCKKILNNQPSTIGNTMKAFKKFMHKASDKGIHIPISYKIIKSRIFRTNRTFLVEEEINRVYDYYNSIFINQTHKNILQLFLFSCFTGLRFSDISNLSEENFMDDFVVFTTEKTKKIQRVPLNETAKIFIPNLIDLSFTNQFVNRELKEIFKFLKIRKKITYHVSRHTFATNFYIKTKDIVSLKEILGHARIEQTMIYVQMAGIVISNQNKLMDDILQK